MIAIILDQSKLNSDDTHYFEERYSSYDIIQMSKKELAEALHDFEEECGDVHSCYDTLVNHIGRFVREYGDYWAGEEVAIYARGYNDASYKRYYFNEKGQISNWPYGFFG